MAVVTSSVSVGSSATALYTSVGVSQVQLQNTGATDVYVGNSAVSTSNGFKIAAAGTLTNLQLDHNETLYGVTATTGTIAVLAVRKG